MLHRKGGDRVDYYTFTTDDRYTMGLGVGGQSVNLLAQLEYSGGNDVAVSCPPKDPKRTRASSGS